MKHITTFLFLLIGFSVFAQVDTLKQPATIGQDNRNQRTGRGLQIGRPQLPEVDTCEIWGKLFIPANAGAGKVLTSNGIGLATWQTPTGGGDDTIDVNEVAIGTGTGITSLNTHTINLTTGATSFIPNNGVQRGELIIAPHITTLASGGTGSTYNFFHTDTLRSYMGTNNNPADSSANLYIGHAVGATDWGLTYKYILPSGTGHYTFPNDTGEQDYVLTYNVGGATSWQPVSGIAVSDSAWMLTGNSGTNPAVNFIGTIDNVPLVFRTKNQYSGAIDPINGNTVFGKEAYNYTIGGLNNTAIGASAISTLGASSDGNTGIGNGCGALLSTGDNNTLIGHLADASNDTANNIIALGYRASAATNQFAISDSIENLKFRLNGQTNGYVLTTNGTTANWQPASCGSCDLQGVTDVGNVTTNNVFLQSTLNTYYVEFNDQDGEQTLELSAPPLATNKIWQLPDSVEINGVVVNTTTGSNDGKLKIITYAQLSDSLGGAGVTSVSGTTNRITSTGGSTPVIDIAATYVGQASITTLGTVGTGTWQATPVVTTYGGTGLSSYAQGDLLYYDAGTVLSKLAKNTSATRYLSNTGTNNNPAWSQIDLTNGVTGVLPIENGGTGQSTKAGLFYSLWQNGVDTTITGTTNEIPVSSKLVAANMVDSLDLTKLETYCRRGVAAGTVTMRVYINTTNTLVGATIVATAASTNSWIGLSRTLDWKTNGSFTCFDPTQSQASDIAAVNAAETTVTYDRTLAYYWIVTLQLSTTVGGITAIYNNGRATQMKAP